MRSGFWFICLTLLQFNSALAIAPNFPDPMLIKGHDGQFYAYATGSVDGANLVASSSKDMKEWSQPTEILPLKPKWALKKNKFWAPHVIYRNGKYFLFYSAEPDFSAFENMRLGVAVSSRPMGPFIDSGIFLDTGHAEENIDPMVFEDKSSGKTYLYWGRNGEIAVQELDSSLLKFAKDTSPQILIRPSAKEYQRVVEGPYVIKRGAWYYLFHSGDDCCTNPHYAVLVTRSTSPLGPFEKLSDKGGDGVILKGNAKWQNPGHNSVYQDEKGQDWIIYHAIDHRKPREVSGQIYRVMRISPLKYVSGWPFSSVD